MAKNPKWTNEEKLILKENFSKSEKEKILKLLPNREWNSILIMGNRLGFKRMNIFTKEEIDFIKNNTELSTSQIGRVLNRSKYVVSNKRRELGIITQEKWNNKEISLLKKNHGKFSVDYIAMNIIKNRSSSSIYHKIQELGLQEKTERYDKIGEEYRNYIIENFTRICVEKERTLTLKEFCSIDVFPSQRVMEDMFGSYHNLCDICGFDKNYGFVKRNISVSKSGEKCLSNYERIISDFLYENNIDCKKEVRYSDIIKNYNGGMICDWYINEEIVVEFFGMNRNKAYSKIMNKKIKMCNRNNIQIICVYDKDLLKLKEIFSFLLK